jgi:uncharacterized protein YwqG
MVLFINIVVIITRNVKRKGPFFDDFQGEMKLKCQLVFNGLYCGDASCYRNPLCVQLDSGAEDWQLLTQFDFDENARMSWGDAGRLYFWIRSNDLVQKAFDKAWMISQSV